MATNVVRLNRKGLGECVDLVSLVLANGIHNWVGWITLHAFNTTHFFPH